MLKLFVDIDGAQEDGKRHLWQTNKAWIGKWVFFFWVQNTAIDMASVIE